MFLSLICEYLYLTSINLGLDAIIENIVSQEVTSQLNLCCAIRFVLCHGRGLLCWIAAINLEEEGVILKSKVVQLQIFGEHWLQ